MRLKNERKRLSDIAEITSFKIDKERRDSLMIATKKTNEWKN